MFTQFQPHLSLAWDNSTSDNVTAVFESLPFPNSWTYGVCGVALGSTGPHGTVLRNKDLDHFDLPCETSETSETSKLSAIPADWKARYDQGQLLYGDLNAAGLKPEVGNGNIATQV